MYNWYCMDRFIAYKCVIGNVNKYFFFIFALTFKVAVAKQ